MTAQFNQHKSMLKTVLLLAFSLTILPGAKSSCTGGGGGGDPEPSICRSDSQCAGNQVCNVSTGQCEAPTPPATACGNGITESGEQCDDGNHVTEACPYGDTSCQICAANCTLIAGATSFCGDNVVDASAGESCDLGSAASDGCDFCDVEDGWICTGSSCQFDLANVDCSATPDLSGLTLEHANLRGIDFSGCSFGHASLDHAYYDDGTKLPAGLNTRGHKLYRIKAGEYLAGADLKNADLSGADLSGADFTGADLTGADFSNTQVGGSTWSHTTCPDGSNSDSNGGSCESNL